MEFEDANGTDKIQRIGTTYRSNTGGVETNLQDHVGDKATLRDRPRRTARQVHLPVAIHEPLLPTAYCKPIVVGAHLCMETRFENRNVLPTGQARQ